MCSPKVRMADLSSRGSGLVRSLFELDGLVRLCRKLAETFVPSRGYDGPVLGNDCRAARSVKRLLDHGCGGVVLLAEELR